MLTWPGRPVWTIETVDVTAEMQRRPGQPRSERDAAFAERSDAAMRLPIIVSASLPHIVAPPDANAAVGSAVGSWRAVMGPAG